MAIDGRQIAGQGSEPKDDYNALGPRVIGALIVVVPLVAVVGLAYWTGTWFGGAMGGVLSVLSTVLTAAVLWLLLHRRRR